VKRVTAAVIIENGRLFIARRAPGEALAGFWELPGGKLEPGETPQACLERELLEEFGMCAMAGVEVGRTTYSYAHGEFELIALAVERTSDFTLRVHDQAAWLLRDEVGDTMFAPADVELVAQIISSGYW